MIDSQYRQAAAKALALCAAKDPYFPQPSAAVVMAWGEDFQHHQIPEALALDAVRHMYRQHGDPGFKPTVKMVCDIARKIRRDTEDRLQPAIEGPGRISLAEWEQAHGPFPSFSTIGKAVGDE